MASKLSPILPSLTSASAPCSQPACFNLTGPTPNSRTTNEPGWIASIKRLDAISMSFFLLSASKLPKQREQNSRHHSPNSRAFPLSAISAGNGRLANAHEWRSPGLGLLEGTAPLKGDVGGPTISFRLFKSKELNLDIVSFLSPVYC